MRTRSGVSSIRIVTISDERIEMRAAKTRGSTAVLVAVIAAMLAIIVSAGSASAVTLKGLWAPFNRCPVEDPALLSANINQGTIAVCLAVDSPNGSMKIGNLSLKTGASETQMGVFGDEGAFSAIAPRGSTIVAAPVEIPGGLAALVCPKGADFKGDVCESAASRPPRLNAVKSTLESAGPPSNLSLFAAFEIGAPIVTLPAKLHLQNPLLGPNCYIGSKAHPILLQPATIIAPTPVFFRFDVDGTLDEEAGLIFEALFTNTSQGDSTFAIGTATGCGWNGRLNAAINRTVGLPSPAGNNSTVLNEVTSGLVGVNEPTETDGQDFSAYWHAAIVK
ncbi:MAG TPA: hypothetical protein VFY36_01765 [Solirubrobacteraceae bacterium]|nr:hypothetical protein [Solirubrobacteraceae bacterium]